MPRPPLIEAVGADLVESGNEGRIQFAWPVAVDTSGLLRVVEGGVDRSVFRDDESSASDDTPGTRYVPFMSSRRLRRGHGFVVLGPGYLAAALSLHEPVINVALQAISEAAEKSEAGFRYFPIAPSVYQKLTQSLARQAVEVFDSELRVSRAAGVSVRGRIALSLFAAEPELPYSDRILRRLLAVRIDRDFERFASTLDTASQRLGRSKAELTEILITSLAILQEVVPFEAELRDSIAHKTARGVQSEFVRIVAEAESANALSEIRSLKVLDAVVNDRAYNEDDDARGALLATLLAKRTREIQEF